MGQDSTPSGGFFHRREPRSDSALAQARMASALAQMLDGSPDTATSGVAALDAAVEKGEGSRSGRRAAAARRLFRALALGILIVHAWYIVTTSLLILVYRTTDPSVTILMAYRSWRYGWKLDRPKPIGLKRVPAYVRSMLISVEDGKFYEHHGLDFEAFKRASEINKILGKPLYGGSTLTMQVARTLFLVPEKSYIRKYFEIITALELEALLGKDRILELYFGYAEWGKGVFGIEAAASRWYGKPLIQLSRDQAVRLIAILSSPIKYGPSTLMKSGILRERYAYLSRRFATADSISRDVSPKLALPPQGIEPNALDNEPADAVEGAPSAEPQPSGAQPPTDGPQSPPAAEVVNPAPEQPTAP